MLHVAEIPGLFLQAEFIGSQILRFSVKFILKIVNCTVKLLNWLSEINNLLLFEEQFFLVVLNVIHQDSFILLFSNLLFVCILESLYKLFFGLIKIFD